jgi:hypothetical protein
MMPARAEGQVLCSPLNDLFSLRLMSSSAHVTLSSLRMEFLSSSSGTGTQIPGSFVTSVSCATQCPQMSHSDLEGTAKEVGGPRGAKRPHSGEQQGRLLAGGAA